MKIALVAHEIHDNAGMERCMANLARWLKAHGETVHLYTADERCPLVDEGFTWFQIPTVKKPLALRLWKFSQNSKKIIDWNSYDIVHTNGGIIPKQTVTTIHFCQAAWQEILKAPLFKDPYKWWESWRIWNRKLGGILATAMERKAVLTSRLVVCVSKQAAIETEQYYKPKQKPHVVYNGVSVTEFTPPTNSEERGKVRSSLGVSKEEMVLLFVGGEFARKGLPTLLKSLKIANNPNIKLWVSGRDPSKDVFERMSQEMGLADNVNFLGFFPNLPQLMQAADAFVFPSHYDSFGLVLTEAMATGLPVITTIHAGANELIEHGVNGFVLNSATDADQLAKIIIQLQENPELVKQISKASIKTAQANTWDKMSEGFYNLYCTMQPSSREVSIH